MTKNEAFTDLSSCLHKAAGDEPIFVLRANDPLAPGLVMSWAREAIQGGVHETEKANQAYRVAEAMIAWRGAKIARERTANPPTQEGGAR